MGIDLPLNVDLSVPKTGSVSVPASDGTVDLLGSDSFAGIDPADTWGHIQLQ